MWHMKMAGRIAMYAAYWINGRRVWTDLIDLSSLTDRQHITKGESKEGMQFALGLNFGELEIDWEQQVITARILGKEAGAPPLLSSEWSFNFLSGSKAHGSSQFLQDAQFLQAYNQLEEHEALADDTNWVCANYRGAPNSFIAAIGFILPTFIFVSMSMLPFFLPVVVLIALAFRYRRRPNSSKKEKSF
jgi:hypothetical protein